MCEVEDVFAFYEGGVFLRLWLVGRVFVTAEVTLCAVEVWLVYLGECFCLGLYDLCSGVGEKRGLEFVHLVLYIVYVRVGRTDLPDA